MAASLAVYSAAGDLGPHYWEELWAETLLAAAHRWDVTAVDFSASALAHARLTAKAMGPEIAARITWVEGDLR